MGRKKHGNAEDCEVCIAVDWNVYGVFPCTRPRIGYGSPYCALHARIGVEHGEGPAPRVTATEAEYVRLALAPEARRRLAAAIREEDLQVRPFGIPAYLWQAVTAGEAESITIGELRTLANVMPRLARVLRLPAPEGETSIPDDNEFAQMIQVLRFGEAVLAIAKECQA
jgi:hypothetical protein